MHAKGFMERLGLYGGSFDPVHHAHLILARQALEDLRLDRVIFIPAAESPFKPGSSAAPAEDRLEMVRLATLGEPAFEVDSIEIYRKPPSYTIHTARAYRARFPKEKLFFLVGEDHLESLPKWNDFNELNQIIDFAILSRSDFPLQANYPVVRRRFDLSSTEIRRRVANHMPISYLVPDDVERYIREKKLYQGEELSDRRN
jgi:nicotinate-nucleotide adenylyltransferase